MSNRDTLAQEHYPVQGQDMPVSFGESSMVFWPNMNGWFVLDCEQAVRLARDILKMYEGYEVPDATSD